MTNTTASLVIKVDSSGAARATSELDRLGRAAGDAEGKVGLIPGAMKLIGTVAASAAVATATRAFIAMADESANLRARLRLATDGVEEFNTAQRATFEIAQRSSTELSSVVDLYAKLAQSTGQLGVSQESLLQLTESITQTFQISGASAQEAAGGLRQLSQAMAGGVLRAEEFNSIIESSPRLVKALADGMGIAFGDVRKYVNEGKISSEILVQALLSQTDAIQSEFDQMPLTVGRAMQQVRNALTGLVGDADSAEGASRTLAEAIADFARTLESDEVKNGFATFVSGLSDVVSWAARAGTAIEYLNRSRQAFAGVREQASSAIRGVGFLLTGQVDRAGQEWRAYQGASSKIDGAFAPAPAPAAPTATGGIADFAKAPIGPGERPTVTPGGDTGKSAREKITDEERALAQLQRAYDSYLGRLERANALHGETTELAAVNYEIQRGALQGISDEEARALRLAAERADTQKAAAEQRTREWEAFADDMRAIEGVWAQVEREVKDSAGRVSEFYKSAARNMQSTMSDLFFDPIADNARSMADRFGDAIRRMAADLASSRLLETLGTAMSGYGGQGMWGNIIRGVGGAMQGGRAFGGPVQAGQSYRVGERGHPEIFTPSTSGRVTPMGAGGQTVNRITIQNAPPGTEVSEPRQNAMGGFDMNVIIGQIEKQIGGNIAQGTGAAYSGVKGRFNLRDAV